MVLEFGSANNKGFNPKVNLAYTATRRCARCTRRRRKVSGPAVRTRRFRSRGPAQCLTGPGNLQSLGLTAAPNQFNPDNVWSYEIGEKARALGNTFQINSAVYYESWTNVQQLVDPSCGFGFTSNAGSASIYGSEIELAANLSPAWMVTQNLGLTHATFDHTVEATNTVKGQKLLDVPNVTANTSVIYSDAGVGDLQLQRPRHLHLCGAHAGHHVCAQQSGRLLVGELRGRVSPPTSSRPPCSSTIWPIKWPS